MKININSEDIRKLIDDYILETYNIDISKAEIRTWDLDEGLEVEFYYHKKELTNE